MNSNYDKDINNIRNTILKLNSSINSKIDSIPEENNIKNIQGNKYELSQFQYKVSSLNYRRNLKKNIGKKPENINNLNNMDELSKFIQENDYKKIWSKLDNFQKKKKLIEYIKLLDTNHLIKKDLLSQLRQQLLIKLKHNKLKSKKVVEYDENNSIIKNISILTINPDKTYIIN
jgi:hypothetical protein